MRHPGRVFSREQLLNVVWGSDIVVETPAVDVLIGRPRGVFAGRVRAGMLSLGRIAQGDSKCARPSPPSPSPPP